MTTNRNSIAQCLPGLFLCIWTTFPAHSEDKSPASFVGEWCNKDFATDGITRVHIRQDGAKLIAHLWGRCVPKECDQGEATATVEEGGKVLSFTRVVSFKTETQKLTLLADGTLELVGHKHFTDASGRPDQDIRHTFAKGLTHDWNDAKNQ